MKNQNKTLALLVNEDALKPFIRNFTRDVVNGALEAGYNVQLVDIDSFSIRNNNDVSASSVKIDQPLPKDFEPQALSWEKQSVDPDVYWSMTRGQNRIDTLQILMQIQDNLNKPFVNSPASLLKYDSKYGLMMAGDHQAKTHIDSNADALLEIINERPEENFVLKRPGSTASEAVFKVKSGQEGLEELVRDVCTDPETGEPTYALLQEFLPQLAHGNEKRVLLAGGKVYPAYTHTPDHSGKTMKQGALDTLTPCELSDAEYSLCQDVAKKLHEDGCNYAGIDLAFPHIIEVNVLNPDGIRRIKQLTQNDKSAEIVGQVIKATLESHRKKERSENSENIVPFSERFSRSSRATGTGKGPIL